MAQPDHADGAECDCGHRQQSPERCGDERCGIPGAEQRRDDQRTDGQSEEHVGTEACVSGERQHVATKSIIFLDGFDDGREDFGQRATLPGVQAERRGDHIEMPVVLLGSDLFEHIGQRRAEAVGIECLLDDAGERLVDGGDGGVERSHEGVVADVISGSNST